MILLIFFTKNDVKSKAIILSGFSFTFVLYFLLQMPWGVLLVEIHNRLHLTHKLWEYYMNVRIIKHIDN